MEEGEEGDLVQRTGRKLVSFSVTKDASLAGGSLGGGFGEGDREGGGAGNGAGGGGEGGDGQEDWVRSGVVLPQLTEQEQAVAAASAKLEQVRPLYSSL